MILVKRYDWRGINDTDSNFNACVKNTVAQFAGGVIDTGGALWKVNTYLREFLRKNIWNDAKWIIRALGKMILKTNNLMTLSF